MTEVRSGACAARSQPATATEPDGALLLVRQRDGNCAACRLGVQVQRKAR